jgi:hypothetical protein
VPTFAPTTGPVTVQVTVQRAVPESDALQLYVGLPGAGQTLFGICGQSPAPVCATGNTYKSQFANVPAGVDIPYRIEYVSNANAMTASVRVLHEGVFQASNTITWTYA